MKKWWKKNNHIFYLFGGIILILSIVFFFGWFDYYVWRLQHPTAPFWTWFFSHGNR